MKDQSDTMKNVDFSNLIYKFTSVILRARDMRDSLTTSGYGQKNLSIGKITNFQ